MSLGKKTLTSTGWIASTVYINTIIAFVSNVFLARLLLPDEFGVYALAASFLSLLFMVSGFGTQESIVQCRDDTIQNLIPTAFWMTIALGFVLAIVGSGLGVFLHPRYGEEIAFLVMSLSWLSFVRMIGNTYAAILKRDMSFKPIAKTQTIGTILSFGLAIVAAYNHWGVWSLFVREAAQTIFELAGLAWVSGYWLQRKFDLRSAQWIWGFGWKVMVNRIGEVLFERVDKLAVGSFLGTAILGQYSMAYRLAFLGHQFSYGVVQSIAHSAFSTIQNEVEKLSRAFEKLYFWLFRFALISGLLVWFCGSELVLIIYGPQWQLAGEIFQHTAIFLVLLPLETSLRSFLIGAGYINANLSVRIWQLILFVPLVIAAAYWGGIMWVVWSINLSIWISWLLAVRYTNKVIPVRWDYLMQKPSLAGLLTFVGATALNRMGYLTGDGFFGVILQAGVVGMVFVTTLYLLERHSIHAELANIQTRLASN